METGMLYFNLPFKNWEQILAQIPPDLIYIDDEHGISGYNFNPELIISSNIPKSVFSEDIDLLTQELSPFSVKIEAISSVITDDFDVLKLDISLTPQLKKVYELFFSISNNIHTINPYVVLCYMLKNTSQKFTSKYSSKPILYLDTLIYRDYKNNIYKYYL